MDFLRIALILGQCNRRWRMGWEEVTAREKKPKAEFGVVMSRAQTNTRLFGEHSIKYANI